MEERRAEARHRVFKGGLITFGNGGVPCTVRNLSRSGAAIEIANPAGIPNRFILVIESDQVIRRCRLRWHDGKRIGVAFEAA